MIILSPIKIIFPRSSGLQKPRILVQLPGPTVSFGDGQPLVAPVGSNITELEYVNITLTCPTEGAPPPKITWRKDGVDLAIGGRYMVDNNGSLTIQQALIKDSGKFTCSAENTAGVQEVTSHIDILGTLSQSAVWILNV